MDQAASLRLQSNSVVCCLLCESTQKLEVLVKAGEVSGEGGRGEVEGNAFTKEPAAPAPLLESKANKMKVCGLIKMPGPTAMCF